MPIDKKSLALGLAGCSAPSSLEGVDKVTLVVSTGPKEEPVTVINFVTMTEQEARDAASALGPAADRSCFGHITGIFYSSGSVS